MTNATAIIVTIVAKLIDLSFEDNKDWSSLIRNLLGNYCI